MSNPGLAADLQESYNPATAAARCAMLTQNYGVRASTLLNILDQAENEDPLLEVLTGGLILARRAGRRSFRCDCLGRFHLEG